MPPREKREAPFQLSPEQLALQAARRELKAKKEAAKLAGTDDERVTSGRQGAILKRDWAPINHTLEQGTDASSFAEGNAVTIMTWNLLAQSLVRRELFPESDALKAATRLPMLPNEILAYDADILCLQEADQLDVLLPALKSRYLHVYASGRSKNHGCMILYKPEYFELISERTVYYDEEEIRVGTPEGMASADQAAIWRKGVSRKTGNIALLVGLRDKRDPTKGFVVGTTHLFWHGAFTAERTKQMIILLREMAAFRNEIGAERWPCMIAGDLNLPPDDITYSMLVGETVTESQYEAFNESRVVHVSIDPSIGHTEESKLEDEENDPDRKVWNCRPCTDADGLLRADELEDMFKASGISPLRSVYDEATRKLPPDGIETSGQRSPHLEGRKGAFEPMFTSYTHYWKSTLDYIFISVSSDIEAVVTRILKPHRQEDLGTGLPKKGVCGSDHVSLAATIVFSGPRG